MALTPPIGSGVPAITPAFQTNAATAANTSTDATSGAGFGDAVSNALDNLQASETKTDSLAKSAATGRLQNVEDYLISASENQLNMQLTVAVRNKAVESFNDIMKMQV